jgi:hypothetical protein
MCIMMMKTMQHTMATASTKDGTKRRQRLLLHDTAAAAEGMVAVSTCLIWMNCKQSGSGGGKVLQAVSTAAAGAAGGPLKLKQYSVMRMSSSSSSRFTWKSLVTAEVAASMGLPRNNITRMMTVITSTAAAAAAAVQVGG